MKIKDWNIRHNTANNLNPSAMPPNKEIPIKVKITAIEKGKPCAYCFDIGPRTVRVKHFCPRCGGEVGYDARNKVEGIDKELVEMLEWLANSTVITEYNGHIFRDARKLIAKARERMK